MQEGQLRMTQVDRDRLVALKKVKKNVITQREAAAELELSIGQVQRLLSSLNEHGDKAVVHGLRGRLSNRKIEEQIERLAVEILTGADYAGFGPTLASEYLGKRHGIEATKETVRQWMMRAKQWRGRKRRSSRCMGGGRGGAGLGSWCSGTPARTIGWKDAGIPDRHDRRSHQPVIYAVRAPGFHRTEHANAVELRGEVRPTAKHLHG
jgi:transposase